MGIEKAERRNIMCDASNGFLGYDVVHVFFGGIVEGDVGFVFGIRVGWSIWKVVCMHYWCYADNLSTKYFVNGT